MDDGYQFIILDIWLNKTSFYDDLKTFNSEVEPFAGFYLDEKINNTIVHGIDLIFQKFQTVPTKSINKNNFRIDFFNKFRDVFSTMVYTLKGDLAKYQKVEDIGNYNFKGEQETKIKGADASAFGVPEYKNNYNFKQKSDFDLARALEFKAGAWTKWLEVFSLFFENDYSVDADGVLQTIEQVEQNTADIVNIKIDINELDADLTAVQAQTDLNTDLNNLQVSQIDQNSTNIGLVQTQANDNTAVNNLQDPKIDKNILDITNLNQVTGELGNLQTDDKSNLVNSINEIDNNTDVNTANIEVIAEAVAASFSTWSKFEGSAGALVLNVETFPVWDYSPGAPGFDEDYITFNPATTEFTAVLPGDIEFVIRSHVSIVGEDKTAIVKMYTNGLVTQSQTLTFPADQDGEKTVVFKDRGLLAGDVIKGSITWTGGVGSFSVTNTVAEVNFSTAEITALKSSQVYDDYNVLPAAGINPRRENITTLQGSVAEMQITDTSLQDQINVLQVTADLLVARDIDLQNQITARELPIGTIIIGPNHPNYGTWQSVTGTTGFPPLFGSSFGSTTSGSVKKHNHQWQGSPFKQAFIDKGGGDAWLQVSRGIWDSNGNYSIINIADGRDWTGDKYQDCHTNWNAGYTGSNYPAGVYTGTSTMWKRTG